MIGFIRTLGAVSLLGLRRAGRTGLFSCSHLILTQENKDIFVDYRLQKEGNECLVYDVSIEGVSLVNNYRTQFSSIILQSSFENLSKKLKAKVALE